MLTLKALLVLRNPKLKGEGLWFSKSELLSTQNCVFLPFVAAARTYNALPRQRVTGSIQLSQSTTAAFNCSMASGIKETKAAMGAKVEKSILEMKSNNLTSAGAVDFPVSSRTRGKSRANKEQDTVNISKIVLVITSSSSYTASSADSGQKEFLVPKRNQSPDQAAAEKPEPRPPTRKQPHRGELQLQNKTLLSIYARVLARAGPGVERSARIATAEKQLHTKYTEMATLPFASKWSMVPTKPPPRSGSGVESQDFTRNKVMGKRFT